MIALMILVRIANKFWRKYVNKDDSRFLFGVSYFILISSENNLTDYENFYLINAN